MNTVTRAVGLVALVAYARLLPPTDLAALPVFLILASFVTIPFNLGLYPTLMRELPKLLVADEEEARGMIRTVVLAVGGGVMVVAVAYLALAPVIARTYFDTGAATSLVRWMVAGTVLRGCDEIMIFVLRATREYRLLASKKVVSEVAQPLLALPLTWVFGIRGLILGLTIGLALGVCWAIWGARRYLFGTVRPMALGPLASRSRPYYLEGFLFFLTQQGDQALVGALLSPTVLTAYYIARRIPDALSLILSSVEEVMGPTLSRAAVDGPEAVEKAFRTMALVVGIFIVPASALAASLGGAYLTLMGWGNYGFALPTVLLLTLATIPLGATTIASQTAMALGHPTDRLKITVTFAGLLLALTALAIPFGLNAVAAGRATAIVVAASAGLWLTRSFRPRIPWTDLGRVVVPTVLLVGATLGLQVLSASLWLVPVAAIAGCSVFAAASYLLLSRAERAQLLGGSQPT